MVTLGLDLGGKIFVLCVCDSLSALHHGSGLFLFSFSDPCVMVYMCGRCGSEGPTRWAVAVFAEPSRPTREPTSPYLPSPYPASRRLLVDPVET